MDEHITIGDVAPRVQYAADGVQASFTYPFPIFAEADIEVRFDNLLQPSGYQVLGAGASNGGEVVFAVPPPAGTRVTLRRSLVVSRTTDFQENGVLRARTLNDELDYQVAALQEVKQDVVAALHLDPSEVGGATTLPLRGVRANTLLGFDSLGDVTVFDRAEGTVGLAFPGAVPRTVEDKLAETLSARDFGATGDGATDDGPALQAALNAAAASSKVLEIGEGTFRTTMPLILLGAAAGLTMRGTILYAGPDGQAALTLGDAGAVNNQRKSYRGLSVVRAILADWSDEGDVGIRIRNIDACVVEVRQAEGFTIGVQLIGDLRGCEDSDLYYGRIIDNRIGVDLRTLTGSGWMNSLRHHGGHFACRSASNPTRARFGVRFSAAPGAYTLHNAHLFVAPAFELQRQGTPGTVDAIPFLLEVDGRSISATGIRMEACSPFVARHTGAFNDATYEVDYVGTYAFTGAEIDYTPTATRAGGSVLPLHQAAAALASPRLVAAAPNLRSRAFRQTLVEANGIGFDELAVLASSAAGTTLNAICLAGLDNLPLNPEGVGLVSARALAFVVDCSRCKEFVIAAEGVDLTPVVVQFDAAETVLDETSPALFSNMNTNWSATAKWHAGNGPLDNAPTGIALDRHQRIRLHANASFAAIGVTGSATAQLQALRLFTSALYAPRLLFGGSRAWGNRELTGSVAWDPPSIASLASTTVDVAVQGARPGDFARVGFSTATTLPLDGWVAASNTVRARITNSSGGAVDLAPGTVYARVVKPRV